MVEVHSCENVKSNLRYIFRVINPTQFIYLLSRGPLKDAARQLRLYSAECLDEFEFEVLMDAEGSCHDQI